MPNNVSSKESAVWFGVMVLVGEEVMAELAKMFGESRAMRLFDAVYKKIAEDPRRVIILRDVHMRFATCSSPILLESLRIVAEKERKNDDQYAASMYIVYHHTAMLIALSES